MTRPSHETGGPAQPVADVRFSRPRTGLPRREPHHRQRRAAVRPIRVAQRLPHVLVEVAVGRHELDGLSRGLERGGEVLGLALELGRLQGAVGHHHGRGDAVEVALRAHGLLHRVGEGDVVASPGQPHGLEVVHPAHQEPALHGVGGQPELGPVGGQRHGREVPARRVPADEDARRIAPKALGVPHHPGDAPSHLVGHPAQVAVELVHGGEVERYEVGAAVQQHLGRKARGAGIEVKPDPAVDEHEHGPARLGRPVDVHGLVRALAVGHALGIPTSQAQLEVGRA